MDIILPLQNIKIIEFSTIFTKSIETDVLNELNSYDLIVDDNINIKNKDVRRIMYHHIIYGVCEYILTIKTRRKILIHYCTIIQPVNQLNDYVSPPVCMDFFNRLIQKMSKILPIKFMIDESTLNAIKHAIKSGGGYGQEVSTRAKSIINDFS